MLKYLCCWSDTPGSLETLGSKCFIFWQTLKDQAESFWQSVRNWEWQTSFWKLTTASQSQTIKKSHHHTTLALLGDWHFRSPRVHASSDFRLIWASPSQTWVTVSSCRKWSTKQSTAIQENMIQLFEGGRHKSMRRNRQPLPRHTAQNSARHTAQNSALHSCMTHLSVHMHITHTHTTFFRRQNQARRPDENKDLDGLAQHYATIMVENLPFHCILLHLEFYHIHILPTHMINFLNKQQLVNRAKNHQILWPKN